MENNSNTEKKIVLIGGGGHCKSVIDTLIRTKEYAQIVVTDYSLEPDSSILGCKVIGNDDKLSSIRHQGFQYAFITVGSIINPQKRKELSEFAKSLDFTFPVIADPSAIISQSACIGEGTFIGKNVIVNAEAKLGTHCIVNTGTIIGHECVVGDYTHVAAGVVVCGDVHLGNECFIGAGTTVIQGRKIGERTIIGAGSTVISDLKDDMKVYGLVKSKGENNL